MSVVYLDMDGPLYLVSYDHKGLFPLVRAFLFRAVASHVECGDKSYVGDFFF